MASHPVARLFEKIVPFIIVGISIAVAIALLILFSYVLVWGLVIGLVLFVIAYVKNKFFTSKSTTKQPTGRIIEHDDKTE